MKELADSCILPETPSLTSVQASAIEQYLARNDDARLFEDYLRWRRGAALLVSTNKEMQEFERFNAEGYILGLMLEEKRRKFEEMIWDWKAIVRRHSKALPYRKLMV